MKPRVFRRNLLIEATLALLLARLAVRLLSAARITAWASRPPRRPDRFAADTVVEGVSKAVEEIAAKPWMQALCLPQALATHAMLRRRGVAGRLCLGAVREGGALAAHAWVELGDEVLVGGGTEQAQFTRLVTFG
jgi:transglutaminase-like putative cysteine protease